MLVTVPASCAIVLEIGVWWRFGWSSPSALLSLLGSRVAQFRRRFILSDKADLVLPDWTVRYLLLWELLASSQILVNFTANVRLDRSSGYAAIDLLMVLVAYF